MAEFISLVFIIWVVWVFLKAITQSHNSRFSKVDHSNSESITWANRYPERIPVEPLKGKELLEKIKELVQISKSELVQLCGYSFTKKGGGTRLNYLAFYEALLEAKAKGINELIPFQRSEELETLT